MAWIDVLPGADDGGAVCGELVGDRVFYDGFECIGTSMVLRGCWSPIEGIAQDARLEEDCRPDDLDPVSGSDFRVVFRRFDFDALAAESVAKFVCQAEENFAVFVRNPVNDRHFVNGYVYRSEGNVITFKTKPGEIFHGCVR